MIKAPNNPISLGAVELRLATPYLGLLFEPGHDPGHIAGPASSRATFENRLFFQYFN